MMVNAISGGPAPTGLETGPRPHDLPQGQQQARAASLAAAGSATPAADPALVERPVAYGVAGTLQAHESAARHDAKKKLAAHDRGAGEQVPQRTRPEGYKGHTVDVDA